MCSIIFKLQETKDKQKILKEARVQRQLTEEKWLSEAIKTVDT